MIKNSAIICAPPPPSIAAPGSSTRRIAGVVLLSGSVRPTQFYTAVQRALLDLPYAGGVTLLQAWVEQVNQLAASRGRESIPLRILTDQSAPPLDGTSLNGVPVRVDRDPSAWRGTGGVLRDISLAYPAEQFLLVANAAQFLLRPLAELVADLDELQADVGVFAHADGTPSTLMLVRCTCLRTLPELGFVDMKEQAIPLIAVHHSVKVVTEKQVVTLGLRTAQSYVQGLRAFSIQQGTSEGVVREDWESAFSIVEEGATVEQGARMHDSVVLRGGKVGNGAVLVRSVICPGGVVAKNETVVDKLVSSMGVQSTSEEGT